MHRSVLRYYVWKPARLASGPIFAGWTLCLVTYPLNPTYAGEPGHIL